ncbi:J domain-containing protein [Gemmatimonas groenlandica]|uniref:J domain-containing protein n=1 Tax=Gemmatimonas groenlandica TaxID=2732249 RepID=A0A6M4IR29_9BACT|nr:J domain-containing protein [Gemmatimonas groenlandica]QJR37384.1 J domain-containing protein [Gemmatimonas groenlandica]
MTTNRRNHYRLLHVQPDAPAAVIKAAYRALIATRHPDVGGNEYEAVLLNDAYAVLSDPAKRAAYDARRAARTASRHGTAQPAASAHPTPPAHVCPMCHLGLPSHVDRNTRCARCHAPLAPVRVTGSRGKPMDRRGIPRVSKSDWAIMYVDWRSDAIDVRMRDLSLDGISVYSGLELPLHRVVRIVGQSFDVVATAVGCRRLDAVFTVHASLASALFAESTGGFVSATA